MHVDVKKLGRILAAGHRVTGVRGGRATQTTANGRGRGVAGWEFVHVCVDDNSRLAYVEVLGDECAQTAIGFLERALGWFAEQGVEIRAVLSDNGSCYRRRFSEACRARGLRHLQTRPYRPQTKTLVSQCTSWARFGGSPVGEVPAEAFDEAWIARGGRLEEPLVLVVGLAGLEQVGALPGLHGGRVHAEAVGDLGEREQAPRAQSLGVAWEAVGTA